MPVTKKFNKVNFSYFFTTSFLSLLAVFVFLLVPLFSGSTPVVKKTLQQFPVTPGYSLEPQPQKDIEVILAPNPSYGVGVILKDPDGEVIIDQNNLYYYEWMLSDPTIATVSASGFTTGCPYAINSPCPNLHADVVGLKIGDTTLTVNAFKTNETNIIASTVFNVKVVSQEALINYKVKFRGINSKPANSADQLILVKGYNYNSGVAQDYREFTVNGPAAPVDNNGVYTGYINLNFRLLNVAGYKLCFKGPKHLQKCFKDITFSRGQILDFTSQPLDPGDLPLPQDAKADQNDFNYLWNNRGSSDPNVLVKGDLNLDNNVNMGDINLILETLQTRSDEEGW